MRTLIVAVTCLALGATLNAQRTGAKTSDWGAEKAAVKEELQALFRNLDREGLEDLLVVKEWRNRRLSERNSQLLRENNDAGYELLEVRNKLRKCEKKIVRKPAE